MENNNSNIENQEEVVSTVVNQKQEDVVSVDKSPKTEAKLLLPNPALNYNNPKKSNSVIKKLLIIGIMVFALLIPANFVMSLIEERQSIKKDALEEVSSKWGQTQNLGGPIMYVPLVYERVENNVFISTVKDYIKILPDNLWIKGNTEPEIRYRGIYKFVLYTSKLNVTGNFLIGNLDSVALNGLKPKWEDAFVQIGISDMIGIKDLVKLKWNNEVLDFYPGNKVNDVFQSGMTANIKFSTPPSMTERYSFNFDLNVKGSEEMTFLPLGKETVVKIASNWGNPSFSGAFLPEERNISANNFDVTWKILDLNRNYPQKWTGISRVEDISKSKFGINFLIPVDAYKQTMRAVKYMLMFVALTFVIFFVIEIMYKRRIHPIQYLFVGFSLVLFYLLLVSLSEHMNFYIAYTVSSISIVLMIALYSWSILGGRLFAVVMGLALSFLYGFLYVLLENQDYSLLLGSLGLFSVLALMMFLTRRVNWYELEFGDEEKLG